MSLPPKRVVDSYTEMTQVVLPNDANPLGFMLGGAVMHLIDIAGAITALRHVRKPVVTAAVDSLEFLNPIKVGDLILLEARVTGTFATSLEVQVLVQSEGTLTGRRETTSRAYLTFVTVPDSTGVRSPVPELLLETEDDRTLQEEARRRRAEHLRRRRA
jgi:acyl-CoA hydrolase